jgi:ABC-2 type transport system permease protein
VAILGFGVPLRGSFVTLLFLTQVFLLTTLGLGLLLSTLVRTQQQAMMTTAFGLLMPMVYLSGLIFPIENMPAVIQWVTYTIPLRYYATIIRGVFLKGSGLAALWPQGLALLLMGLAILGGATLRFRKRLD